MSNDDDDYDDSVRHVETHMTCTSRRGYLVSEHTPEELAVLRRWWLSDLSPVDMRRASAALLCFHSFGC